MSIQVGKAEKFVGVSKSGANVAKLFGLRKTPWLKKPLPPRAFSNVKVGPELALEFEDVQALPVDGSNSLLRNLSPFMIQIEPPLVFANEPQSTGKSKAVGIFDAAFSKADHGKAPIEADTFKASAGMGGSVEEVLAKGYPEPQTNKSGDGTKTLSDAGPPGKLGNPQIADLKTAIDIVTQLGAILSTPPLVLLINPTNLSMNYTRIHQFTDRSRFGYIYQAWGEEKPHLNITAKCGAFYSGGRGVQAASKRDSAAWQNLMALFHLYRSNGYIYDTVGKSNAHLFVGGLSIHYDGWIYYGNMENLSWTFDDTANQLGGIEFTMEFVVAAMVDTSKQTQTVLPMRSVIPTRDPSKPYWGDQRDHSFETRLLNDNSLQQNFGVRQVGGNTLSVGLDGDVRGRFFGAGPGFQPAETSPPPSGGDPDFATKTSAPRTGSTTVARGGGFLPPASPSAHTATDMTERPLPFKGVV